jgi:hypothetical protein
VRLMVAEVLVSTLSPRGSEWINARRRGRG